MPSLECISDADLRAFLLGELPDRLARPVCAHLEACPECEAAARRLDGLTDPALEYLRRGLCPAANSTMTLAAAGLDTPAPAKVPGSPGGRPPRVAGYEVLGELGRGGMSVAYQARQVHPARVVALKMILTGHHAGAERRARFLAEADAIARLQHANVVQIFEVGEHDGLPFLALEHVDGGTLAERLGGRPQPPRWAAEMVETLARAVQHAHERGIVHRDLKPANVLLTGDGTPKVTDFGLAKHERPELTATGAVLGTPGYMAPEQAAGDRAAVGPAADVYSLGAILYALLTGRPPFAGPTALDTLEQVRSREPVPPRRLQPRTPRDLETICLTCLRKEPGRRYASALALADDLRRFLDGQPVRARPVGPAGRAWRWGRRNPVLALLTAGLLLLPLLAWTTRSLGRRPPTAGPDEPRAAPLVQPSAAPPLRVVRLDVEHFHRDGGPVGLLGRSSFRTRCDDQVRVTAGLSMPAYCYLVAYRPDGTEELCFPEAEDAVPPLTDRPRYPSVSPGLQIGLNEGPGLHAFVLVARSRPLPPYAKWRQQHGPSPWTRSDAVPGVVYCCDGDDLRACTAEEPEGRGKGQEARGVGALPQLVEWLRRRTEAEAVSAVAFGVRPRP